MLTKMCQATEKRASMERVDVSVFHNDVSVLLNQSITAARSEIFLVFRPSIGGNAKSDQIHECAIKLAMITW